MIAEEKYGFPPTYKLILKRLMPAGRLKVLDLGCGTGIAGEILNKEKKHEFTGIDIYEPYLKICKRNGFYKAIEKKDLTKLDIKKGRFDVILLFQVIEHLTKKDAMNLLRNCYNAASKAVIVTVPNGECHQEGYDGNTHHQHKSAWSVDDLRKKNFKVIGQGLKIIYGDQSYGEGREAAFWQKIAVPLSTLLLPLLLFIPQLGVQLIAIKTKVKES